MYMANMVKRNMWLLLGIGVVVAALAWYGLSSGGASTGLLSSSNGSGSADSDVVSTLLQLRSITLSGGIFSDPLFATLRDFSTDIIPEPVGRPDPFAPISPTATTTETAATKHFPIPTTPTR